jgi:signal transduction histidine kinase
MERLVQVVQELSMARDLGTIVALVGRAARELTGADGATFVLRESDACYYADEDAIEPLWKGKRFPIERCISGWTMEHREAVVLDDIYADARIPADAYCPTFVKSFAMVPIRRKQPVGAIGSYWAELHRPSEVDVRLLQALADSAAIAMENIELVNKLEARFDERGEQLEAANRELESFSYAVSHDLRAPLRAIKGFSQILVEDHAAALADGKHHLDRICAATTRMNQLIDDLLMLSKMVRTKPDCAAFDLAPIAREIVEDLRRTDPGRVVEITIAPELPAYGDARLVRVVLENLLRNAWKFTSKRPAARIEVGSRAGAWFVCDDGVGFDSSRAGRLFVPFQRMHAAAEFEGSGIGLAIAHRIVRRHGGRIWADSKPDHGATFSFTLASLQSSS